MGRSRIGHAGLDGIGSERCDSRDMYLGTSDDASLLKKALSMVVLSVYCMNG